jgi:hypothetical protein
VFSRTHVQSGAMGSIAVLLKNKDGTTVGGLCGRSFATSAREGGRGNSYNLIGYPPALELFLHND